MYNRGLLPLIRGLMPNQATHWPLNYKAAMETSRDRAGHLHCSSLDIPAHMLAQFVRSYLESVQALWPYFCDAYFGHELQGWKVATVHNVEGDAEDAEDGAAYECVNALHDLTRVLNMQSIHQDQWLIDIGWKSESPERL